MQPQPPGAACREWAQAKDGASNVVGPHGSIIDAYPKNLKPKDLPRLVAQGADLEATDDKGSSLLIRAAAVGDVKMTEALLAQGATIEQRNHYAQTALVASLTHQRPTTAQMLIDAGADQEYALRQLRGPANTSALELLAEVCGESLKAPYRLLPETADDEPEQRVADLLVRLRSHRPPSSTRRENDERQVIRTFLDDMHMSLEEQVRFLRCFVRRYPFSFPQHAVAGQVLLEAGVIDESVFHLEVARSLDQLNVDVHALLRDAYDRKRAPGVRVEAGGLKERFCRRPFEHFVSNVDGAVYLCCPSWLPMQIGSTDRGNWPEIWNSEPAVEIRRSVVDGDFKYCSRLNCPEIQAGSLPAKVEVKDPAHRRSIDERQFVLDEGPRHFVLGHDLTCNLSCPSCRTQRIVAGKSERVRLDRVRDSIIVPLLPHLRILEMSGSGEFIVSRHCREVLAMLSRDKYPRLRLILLTNGLPFTPQQWRRFSNIHGMVEEIHVSVDAAAAATYRVLRRGGDFQTLLANLDFISTLRRNREIRRLRLNLVVQRANYLEMKALIELGKSLGADRVTLSRITDWATYPLQEFRDADIASPSHPEHEAFLNVLRDPIFADEVVDLYNIYESWKLATTQAATG